MFLPCYCTSSFLRYKTRDIALPCTLSKTHCTYHPPATGSRVRPDPASSPVINQSVHDIHIPPLILSLSLSLPQSIPVPVLRPVLDPVPTITPPLPLLIHRPVHPPMHAQDCLPLHARTTSLLGLVLGPGAGWQGQGQAGRLAGGPAFTDDFQPNYVRGNCCFLISSTTWWEGLVGAT